MTRAALEQLYQSIYVIKAFTVELVEKGWSDTVHQEQEHARLNDYARWATELYNDEQLKEESNGD